MMPGSDFFETFNSDILQAEAALILRVFANVESMDATAVSRSFKILDSIYEDYSADNLHKNLDYIGIYWESLHTLRQHANTFLA